MAYVNYNTYPKTKLKAQMDACQNLGVLAEPLPDTINRSRLQHTQRLVALQLAEQIFSDKKPSSKTRVDITDRLEQERSWIAHYDACLLAYRKGKQRKAKESTGFNLAAIYSMTQAFDAEAESRAALVAEELKAPKKEHKDTVGTVRPATQKPNGKANGKLTTKTVTTTSSSGKMTKEEFLKRRDAERLARYEKNGGRGHVRG